MQIFRQSKYNRACNFGSIYCSFFGRKTKKWRNNNFSIYFMAVINVFINRAPVQRNFFLACNVRVIKPMEKSRRIKFQDLILSGEEVGKAIILLNINPS